MPGLSKSPVGKTPHLPTAADQGYLNGDTTGMEIARIMILPAISRPRPRLAAPC